MPEALEGFKDKFNDYLHNIEKKQKIKIIVAILLILLTSTAIILYFSRPHYLVLYDNLDHKQAGEVMAILQDSNIKAKYGKTSNTVLVQEKDYQKSQVLVATEGLPEARFSLEDFFSGNDLMKTSEEKSKEYSVALGNNIAGVLEVIPGVEKAWVNLTIPESSGFVRNNQEHHSKASVLLYMEDERQDLDTNSVNGIALLVSNAVPGLKPENVTIHGSDGRVLNPSAGDDDNAIIVDTNEQLTLQQTVKTELEDSITNFLSRVYGEGNIVVMANVRLDFDSVVREIQEFSPSIDDTDGIVRSMQELEEKAVNRGIGGLVGTDSNTEEEPQYVEEEDEESSYYKASKTINYEINEVRERIVRAQGQVDEISVAVYINSASIDGGTLDDEQKRELESMVSAAAGIDSKNVMVDTKLFNNAIEEMIRTAMEEEVPKSMKIPPWLYGILVFVLLGIGYFVFTRIRSRKEEEPIDEVIVTEEEGMEDIDLELAGSQVKQQLEKLVHKKPDAVAQLLKNWLSED